MKTLPFAAVMLVATLFGAAACGGGGDSSRKYEGPAASAAAQFFKQERAGGVLPQGAAVDSGGTGPIKSLAVTGDEKKQSVVARVCVEYTYSTSKTPFTAHRRVYIATLNKDGWAVEPVKPEGTCDDVQ